MLYMEKRRGKKEIAVNRKRRGRVKRRETSLASDQSGTHKEIHRVK